MANHEVTPVYDEQLRKLETTDPNHADVFNRPFGQLLNNTAYLKNEVDKVGGLVHYSAFTDISPTFNATTPIIMLFQAMVPNSILDCEVNQANSVYPSAQGSLHLVKLTDSTGSVQFLSSDGKLSTGAFAPVDTANIANEISGGVLRDSKENQSQTAFSGWEEWASELGDLNDLQTKHNSSIVEAVNTVFDQIAYAEDIPPDSDLAEFMKTAKYNVIYRVNPNTNVKNTCVPNTQYSFYVLEGIFIAGYNHNANSKYLCNFINRIFTRWKRVLTQIHSLESLGLTDEDFSDSDFISNLALINEKIGYVTTVMITSFGKGNFSNLTTSLVMQLKKDGLDFSASLENFGCTFKLERESSINVNMKIELMMENSGHDVRNKTIIAYANRDSGNLRFYGFHELAAVQKLAEIELLNGWEPHGGEGIKIAKNGNYVSINFILMNGTTANGTTLFILPENFRPVGKDSSIPIVTFDGGGIIGYIAVSCKTGTVNLYKMAGAENVRIMCAGGFSI